MIRTMTRRTIVPALSMAAAFALGISLVGCAPSSAPQSEGSGDVELGIPDDGFTLDALIAAAKEEDGITVYDSTGKIVDMAEAFAKKYGVKATGVKVEADAQADMVIREGQSGNVQGDVILLSDAAEATGELIPRGYVTSWMPPDKTDVVPEDMQDPLVVNFSANVWAYNTEAYDSCPVDNMWALTTDDWKGKVSLQDPLLKPQDTDFWNQLATHADDEVAAAYKEYFGEDLKTDEDSATAEWVKRLAQNDPLMNKSSDNIAESIGAPGQADPFFGDIATSKFRENEDSGYKLGLCDTMSPWPGRMYPKVALIATKTKSPNTAKLFVDYLLTEEGIAPQTDDGKPSVLKGVDLPADEPSGVSAVLDDLYVTDTSTADKDLDSRQYWQDLWQVNYSG
ncbi:ABC transporter substrate-binding protein [Microbacterium sp. KR10-403]|uniref:ABC transporter substrate-binding protein n=1 Tax=Microbacterium sp. KR10-403 TaxID=3158581 RepID=UPI0032E4F532